MALCGGVAPFVIEGPIEVELQTQTTALADLFCQWPTLRRVSGDALRFEADGIEAAVRWHHDPLQAPPTRRRSVALVALGNQVAIDLQINGVESGRQQIALPVCLGKFCDSRQAHRVKCWIRVRFRV